MLMPSETEMVVNSRGVPPASAIPALAASTWKSWVMLQGVCSPFMLTTPIIGLAMSSSSSPIARMKARCGARSRPSVVTRDRHFFMDVVPALFSFAPCGRRWLREAKTDEGSVSADRDPSSGTDFVRATFSHKGRREEGHCNFCTASYDGYNSNDVAFPRIIKTRVLKGGK